mmetsp:Transcript_23184/g.65469  ORF Transcript_23184/g.65469 Transcript_23184/m.65469 type:complete len:388 (+) Transcript_23184:1270-2433(+)
MCVGSRREAGCCNRRWGCVGEAHSGRSGASATGAHRKCQQPGHALGHPHAHFRQRESQDLLTIGSCGHCNRRLVHLCRLRSPLLCTIAAPAQLVAQDERIVRRHVHLGLATRDAAPGVLVEEAQPDRGWRSDAILDGRATEQRAAGLVRSEDQHRAGARRQRRAGGQGKRRLWVHDGGRQQRQRRQIREGLLPLAKGRGRCPAKIEELGSRLGIVAPAHSTSQRALLEVLVEEGRQQCGAVSRLRQRHAAAAARMRHGSPGAGVTTAGGDAGVCRSTIHAPRTFAGQRRFDERRAFPERRRVIVRQARRVRPPHRRGLVRVRGRRAGPPPRTRPPLPEVELELRDLRAGAHLHAALGAPELERPRRALGHDLIEEVEAERVALPDVR